MAAALSLGGNVRVGLEDNFYLPDGEMARSNGDLIARARRMAEDCGPAGGDGRRDARAAGAARREAGRRVTLPLEGVRVLDLSRLLPGGFCSLLLGDFGADVLKVEDTGMGDYVRWAPPVYEGADRSAASALFLALNRGKRSIRVDLKTDAGREVLLRAGARRRRAARVVPARRARPARRRLRRAARGQPRARLLRDHRLRPGRPVPRPGRARHELPRARRPARPHGRRGRPARAGGRARSPTSAAAR